MSRPKAVIRRRKPKPIQEAAQPVANMNCTLCSHKPSDHNAFGCCYTETPCFCMVTREELEHVPEESI